MSNPDRLLRNTPKADIFNTAYTSGNDILSDDLTLTSDMAAAVFRVYAVFDTAGVLDVRRDRGGTVVTENLNSGANLTADAAHIFDIIVHDSDDGINFQYSATAQILSFTVVEVGGGT